MIEQARIMITNCYHLLEFDPTLLSIKENFLRTDTPNPELIKLYKTFKEMKLELRNRLLEFSMAVENLDGAIQTIQFEIDREKKRTSYKK